MIEKSRGVFTGEDKICENNDLSRQMQSVAYLSAVLAAASLPDNAFSR
jgi:hypothetical protein